jgi:hypothetical protein
MKKIFCILLVLLTLLPVFATGCSDGKSPMKYDSQEDMKEALSSAGLWNGRLYFSDTQQANIYFFDGDFLYEVIFSRSNDVTDKTLFMNILIRMAAEYNSFEALLEAADKIPENLGVYYKKIEVSFDAKKGLVTAKEDPSLTWQFYEDETMKHQGTIYKLNDTALLESEFSEAKKELYRQEINSEVEKFMSRYPGIASNKDVKYNPYAYYRKEFSIVGVASIDDYYNYEYRSKESTHFCIAIEPSDGGYTDRWYIYANRKDFKDLYNALLSGSKPVILIGFCEYYESTSHSLATLKDYYI